METELYEIIKFLSNTIIDIKGSVYKGIKIKYLKEPAEVDDYTLDWINPANENKQQFADSTKAKAIICSSDIEYSNKLKEQGKVLIIVENPKLCIAQIASKFFVQKIIPKIHPNAIIHPEAKIGEDVFIGPNCIIGKCIIGNKTYIEGNNYIYDNVIIKGNVEIHAGAIIGSEAHNFVTNENGFKIKFPHLGSVIIEDNVLIGANTVISRGVLSKTIVGINTKIAQMVFIGANNIIGSNCAIRPNVMTSGSVKVGDNTIIASSATIRDQMNIGNNCFVGMGAVVTKDIPDGETWIGNPAKPLTK